jgi:hypothetical protein
VGSDQSATKKERGGVFIKSDVPGDVAEKPVNPSESRPTSLAAPCEFSILEVYLFQSAEG